MAEFTTLDTLNPSSRKLSSKSLIRHISAPCSPMAMTRESEDLFGTKRRLSWNRHLHRSAIAPLFSVDLDQSGIRRPQKEFGSGALRDPMLNSASGSATHPSQEHRPEPGLCMSIHLVRGVVVVSAMALALPPPEAFAQPRLVPVAQ